MNVKGFNADGNVTELRVASQNENMVSLSTRFSNAMSTFPQPETEEALLEILSELPPDNDFSNIVRFQCQREIAKCKIHNGKYDEAIPFLIESLKTDESRTDIWAQLAMCAQKTQNLNLFRAANSRIYQIRPQIQIEIEDPPLPSLCIPDEQPHFIGFNLAEPCWRLFLRVIEDSIKTNPYDVPEFVIPGQLQLKKPLPVELFHPPHIRLQSVPRITKQQIVKTLGGCSLVDFFSNFIVQEISACTWLFSLPLIILASQITNEIAKLPFTNEICPKDISNSLINIGLNPQIFNELTPATKLFLAELSFVYREDKCKIFLCDVNPANLHSQNALLRIAFATLEQSIRNNLPYQTLEIQLLACRKHLDKDLCIAHAGVIINNQLLSEKEKQVKILKQISTNTQMDKDEAIQLFEEPQLLSFLSLQNLVSLFLNFDLDTKKIVFSQFLKLLPDLIPKSKNEIEHLSRIFKIINEPMDDECIQQLSQIFKSLSDYGAPPEIIFDSALALAIASINNPDAPSQLSKIHKHLGKLGVCHLRNGKFLEVLLDVLIPRADEYESELTSAFTCYFSDMPLCNINHHSHLQFRCSRFIQPYIEHAYRLENKTNISLFVPYLGIWKHWKSGCGCIKSIDGWRMYKVIKKKESLLSKTVLPNNFTPQTVLEDLLRNDHEHHGESQIALARVLLHSYLSNTSTNNNDASINKLNEAIQLLDNENSNLPQLQMLRAISHALKNDDPYEVIQMLLRIPPFDKPKREARRLYWLIRLMVETNQIEDGSQIANESLKLIPTLQTDFAVPLLCYTALMTHDTKLLSNAISTYCKSRVVSPLPYIFLAKESPPKEAFLLIKKIVRPNCLNINNFFHFEYKPPFLMERIDDYKQIRHDILDIFINSACASGNFKELMRLFHPSGLLNQRPSKVLSQNQSIYGINRQDIYEKYVRELSKVCGVKGDVKKEYIERAIDALARGTKMNCTDSLIDALEELLSIMWKRQTGKEPTEETTVQQLINLINGIDDDENEEEDDEEEDGTFVDESSDDDDDEASEADEVDDDEDDDEDVDEEEELVDEDE
ncbi:hypothetical protein GPJ56_010201 [Histomonas meleagridis]|uniref:uncharacterized protein n=1 Tax=Histomonas meleagridis TaxID=135588 RepID=UPI00355ACBA1|nr:hypothetical protein GPJ56_010201 [Histomonas meleagridis]KAH0797070.1 hypothetical protein GO595_010963 [Histomonas meleagridis]